MTICYFGDFDPDYARNRVIIKGLQQKGVRVLLCNDRSKGLSKYIRLWKRHRQIKHQYDLLIVGYSDSRWLTPFARLLSSKQVIWDGFYSLYDSWVFDRKLVRPNSPKAQYYWFLDWLNCRLAKLILTDTNQHIDYFAKEFNIDKTKFSRVFIGADDDLFHPNIHAKV